MLADDSSFSSCSRYLKLPRAIVCVLVIVFAAGCSEDTSIRQYRVAKSDTRGSQAQLSRASPNAASAKEQLMLGAIVPNKDVAWFFKLTGDPNIVRKSDEQFWSIVKSVEFDPQGKPDWKLSEGWAARRLVGGITYAELTPPEEGLKATVTQLPGISESTEDSWRSYVVRNINRWRNQLSLDEQNWEEMQGDLEEVPELSQGPAKAYLVSLVGRGSGSMGGAPLVGAFGGDGSSFPATADSSGDDVEVAKNQGNVGSDRSSLTYEVPTDWQELETSGMRRAAFSLATGGASAEVTVIAAGGSIDANIGIWLGQVAAEATEDIKKEILEAAQEVPVNGVVARLYTIDGPSAAAANVAPSSILIADIPWRSGESLFVKLKGDKTLAAKQREKFVEFVKSIKW